MDFGWLKVENGELTLGVPATSCRRQFRHSAIAPVLRTACGVATLPNAVFN